MPRSGDRKPSVVTALLLLVCVPLLGCYGADDHEPASDGTIERDVPGGWLGTSLGLPPPKLRRTGHAEYVVPDPDLPLDPLVVDDAEDASDDETIFDQIKAMGPDGAIYDLVTSREEMAEVATAMMEAGQDASSAPGLASSRPKGWARGDDNRVYWPNASGQTDWPRDTMGVVSPTPFAWCSGTLFHDRLVITAAHCLWDGYGNWLNLSFRAGVDAEARPYGEVPHVWKYWPREFEAHECHNWRRTRFRAVCTKWDWAVLELERTPTDENGVPAGYMGFRYSVDDNKVRSWLKYNSGYGACDNPAAFTPCSSLGGDNILLDNLTPCENGNFSNPYQGIDHNVDQGCDTSGGHSGGPLYSWSPAPDGPYIVGVYSAETCNGSECGTRTPNRFLRIYPILAGLMAYYRSVAQ